MLELIVLGKIPGTNLQITFEWVVLLGGALLLALEFYVLRQRLQSQKSMSRGGSVDIEGHNALPVQLQFFE